MNKNNNKNEEDFDWRFEAVTSLAKEWKSPFTGHEYKKGEILFKITKLRYKKGSISFPSVDIVALFLNSSKLNYENACDSYKKIPINRIKKSKQSISNDTNIINFYESIFSSIIFAYTSIEAFANYYIPEEYKYELKVKNETLIYNKTEIERKVKTETKIFDILPNVFNVKLTKQMNCWHEFKKLKNFRDRIIHPKSFDRNYNAVNKETLWNDLFLDNFVVPHDSALKLFKHFIINTTNERLKPRWFQLYPY